MEQGFIDTKELERLFHLEMESLYKEILAETGLRVTRFHQMVVRNGGLTTAKALLQRDIGNRLKDLWEYGRLDLSMEARILHPRWRPLFTEGELRKAREHLRAYHYAPVLDGHL